MPPTPKRPADAYQLARELRSVLPPELLDKPLNEIMSRLSPCRHSVDFAGVVWFGTRYSFTATQRHILKLLWAAWEDGTLDVGQETLLMAAECESGRLVDVFRDHAAWGKMIVLGESRGSYRLAEPPE